MVLNALCHSVQLIPNHKCFGLTGLKFEDNTAIKKEEKINGIFVISCLRPMLQKTFLCKLQVAKTTRLFVPGRPFYPGLVFQELAHRG
jgi:hypothetical protein